jgi:hypothetical protein
MVQQSGHIGMAWREINRSTDQFAERTYRFLSLDAAQPRDAQSLRNWVEGTGSLAREETEYLEHRRELVSLAPPRDNAVRQLETWVEYILIRFYPGFRKVRVELPLT